MRTSMFGVALLGLLILPGRATAQSHALDRGSLLVDGDASFVSTGVDGSDTRSTNIVVRPGVKYFVVPRLAVGGDVRLGYSSSGEFKRTSVGIGPSIDYYLGPLDSRLHPFVSGTVFLATDRTASPAGDLDGRHVRLRGSAGLLFLFGAHAGLNGALFYESARDRAGDTTIRHNSFGLSLGISTFVF